MARHNTSPISINTLRRRKWLRNQKPRTDDGRRDQNTQYPLHQFYVRGTLKINKQ